MESSVQAARPRREYTSPCNRQITDSDSGTSTSSGAGPVGRDALPVGGVDIRVRRAQVRGGKIPCKAMVKVRAWDSCMLLGGRLPPVMEGAKGFMGRVLG